MLSDRDRDLRNNNNSLVGHLIVSERFLNCHVYVVHDRSCSEVAAKHCHLVNEREVIRIVPNSPDAA